MALFSVSKRIVTSATTTPIDTSTYIVQYTIACSDAGSSWTLKIQDKTSGNPFVLVPAFTLIVPTDGYPNAYMKFDEPIPMQGGIDIVTAGTEGEVFVWLVLVQ